MKSENHIIDATGRAVGRIASEVAILLIGKHLPTYAPNALSKVTVTVYNTDTMKITGRKRLQKKYYRHSGVIGNLKEEAMGDLMRRDSRKVLEYAVFGMLPKNRLRKQRMKHITFHKGARDK